MRREHSKPELIGFKEYSSRGDYCGTQWSYFSKKCGLLFTKNQNSYCGNRTTNGIFGIRLLFSHNTTTKYIVIKLSKRFNTPTKEHSFILHRQPTLKVASHVTISLTRMHDQYFYTTMHNSTHPVLGTSLFEEAQFCASNISSSNNDAFSLAAVVLLYEIKPKNKET